MIPVNNWFIAIYYWVGAKAYDFIAGNKSLQNSYYLPKGKALEEFPMLFEDRCNAGAIVYYDGQTNDSRVVTSLALTAAMYGAAVANYVEVKQLIKKYGSDTVTGALVRDVITGEEWEVKAKGVISATGAFTDSIRRMSDENVKDIIVPSGGVHVVLPSYYSPTTMGLLEPETSDGRVLFFLPWEDATLAGTTDAPIDITTHPKPLETEIHFILQEASKYLNPDMKVRRSDVLAAWKGIRPLVKDPNKKNTESLSRNHVIEVMDSKLVVITGGKLTTYRYCRCCNRCF
jgi:glycerol-3-phosphate dehydrogenase